VKKKWIYGLCGAGIGVILGYYFGSELYNLILTMISTEFSKYSWFKQDVWMQMCQKTKVKDIMERTFELLGGSLGFFIGYELANKKE